MKIEITLVIDTDDFFIDEKEPTEREWLFEEILKDTKSLSLFSNEIGDTIGTIIETKNIKEL